MSLSHLLEQPLSSPTQPCQGRLVRASRSTAYARLPSASLGDICTIDGSPPIRAQVVAFNEDSVALAPFTPLTNLRVGAAVHNHGVTLGLNECALVPGSILDAFGDPLDSDSLPTYQPAFNGGLRGISRPPHARERPPIDQILETGIRSIDALTPIGYGQRMGVFAPPGVGKSTLLGILAARAAVDITVIGLIGERGREVNDFIEECLGREGLQRSIVVVSTGDETAIRRATAPHTATRIAEYHRAQGRRVLLLIDSLTRYARALRDLGLAAGEVPLSQGLTPSLYSELPRLLERAGTSATGSITALYTLLSTESSDSDILSEEVKSLLDGHLVLSSRTRLLGYQPAIDPTRSISRLSNRLLRPEEQKTAATVIAAIARLLHDRDIVRFGGVPDPVLASALKCESQICRFMHQERGDPSALDSTRAAIGELARQLTESLR